ncbi:MAG: helix-turn-helix domain-containing protein [Caulobacterales bacterium]|nr:helix-turn-helix domain-containing protein [Caulobacterales bacterium]
MDPSAHVLYISNMTDTADTRIATYNLFGEVGDLPDVVHCETIETRSLLHDWEFAPHRHAGLHQVLLVENGQGRASLDGRTFALRRNTLVNVPIGVVHGFSFASGTAGLVVTLAAEMVDAVLQPSEGLAQVLAHATVMRPDKGTRRTVRDIGATYARRDFARAQILRSLSGLLLGQIARALAAEGLAEAADAAPDLLSRFEALVDAHYADHWGVADYAGALAVSPTHLSRVTRAATGRPATALIEARIMREARRNLIYTNLPISTIAYGLGYGDPAYFSRAFSRATGLAPREFRARADGTRGG